MQVDMAEIELKNNKLDVQWRNYQVCQCSTPGREAERGKVVLCLEPRVASRVVFRTRVQLWFVCPLVGHGPEMGVMPQALMLVLGG